MCFHLAMVKNTQEPLEDLIASFDELHDMYILGQISALERHLGLQCFHRWTNKQRKKAFYLEFCSLMSLTEAKAKRDRVEVISSISGEGSSVNNLEPDIVKLEPKANAGELENTPEPLDQLIESFDELCDLFSQGWFDILKKCLGLLYFLSDTIDPEQLRKAVNLELSRIYNLAEDRKEHERAKLDASGPRQGFSTSGFE